MLPRHVYSALESVVGAADISEDPTTCYSYNYSRMQAPEQNFPFLPHPPVAVVLPESTEEVQQIVRICNRYDVKFKALSSGQCPMAFPGVKDVLAVDLIKMNRIVEIDRRNMYAIIEPMVLAGQLQAEAMQLGMDCHIVSAGPSHSPLASATSFFGAGPKGLTTGFNERNVFGVEWVTPTGEIVRLGSPGSDAGWFSGDGPGPGLRGILRGIHGTYGGTGIYTKIGFKLYPWVGPAKMESTGQHPQIGWKIPDQMRYYHVAWPTIDALTDAFYKLCESRACHSLIRIPPDCTNFFLTPTNNDCVRMFNEGSLPIQRGKHDNALNVILAGHTTREIAFNDEVFKEIVADTGGEFVKLSREQEELLFLNQMNAVYVPRINRTTGSGATVFGVEESADIWPKLTGICADISEKGVADGSMEDHGREALWAWPMEGRYLHAEDAILLDEKKPNVGDTLMKFMMGSMRLISTEALGIQALPGLTGDMLANVVGPQYCNANVWMRRVRDLVDPSRVADYSWHISPEPAVPSPEGSRTHEEKGSRTHEDMRLLFQGMQASFNPKAAGDLQTVIQFQVTGAQPGNWYFSIEKGACALVEGVSGAPTVTINTPAEVWLAIANKEVSPPVALMEGKVKVEGNLSMLMQMENIFGS